MNEKFLVWLLIVIGIICGVGISIIQFRFASIGSRITASVIPEVLCYKYREEYFLTINQSIFCSRLDEFDDLIEFADKSICKVYTSEKKRACEELTEILKMRIIDCFKRLVTETTIEINVNEVERNCQILTS